MKLVLLLSLSICLFHTAANANSSGIFALGDTDLACVFVKEAEEIAKIDESARIACGTRSVQAFDEIGLLRDAYRADPEATLDLIERILKAGKTN